MSPWTPYVLVHRATQRPVVPLDCNPTNPDEGMLVYRSPGAATAAAAHQNTLYALDSVAVRLEDVINKEAECSTAVENRTQQLRSRKGARSASSRRGKSGNASSTRTRSSSRR